MGWETALMIGGGAALGMAASRAMAPKMKTPTLETGGVKGVEAGLADAEERRRSVMTQLSKMRKATLMAKSNMPEPETKKRTLGPGTP
jgi:hypothetical protein